MADIIVAGNTSGAITISAPLVAGSGTLTLPTGTDTLVGKATTDTLTNKSIAATQLTGTIAAARLPSGSVIQVVQASYATPTSNSTTTSASTGLTASITPASISNKILVIVNISSIQNNNSGNGVNLSLYRNSTGLYSFGIVNGFTNSAIVTVTSGGGTTRLDSPATTSATSYTVYFASNTGSGQVVTVQANNTESTITLMEIAG
jgi:hypothetical protein